MQLVDGPFRPSSMGFVRSLHRLLTQPESHLLAIEAPVVPHGPSVTARDFLGQKFTRTRDYFKRLNKRDLSVWTPCLHKQHGVTDRPLGSRLSSYSDSPSHPTVQCFILPSLLSQAGVTTGWDIAPVPSSHPRSTSFTSGHLLARSAVLLF